MAKFVLGLLAAAAAVMAMPASAATILQDDFEDGNVSGWTLSSNHNNPTLTITSDAASGAYAMEVFLEPGQQGNNFYVAADHAFTLAAAGVNAVLSFDAHTFPCSGCTMRYQALIDGLQIYDGTDTVYTPVSVALGALGAGNHTLTLRHFTDAAYSGHFGARFDNVLLSADVAAVPEPATWGMLVLGFGALGQTLRRRRKTMAYA